MEEGKTDETKPPPLSLHRAVSVIPYLHGDHPSVTFHLPGFCSVTSVTPWFNVPPVSEHTSPE
jgi:hypothetical protein